MDKKNKQSTHENKDVSEVKEEIDILKNKAEKLNDLLDMLDDNMFDEWDNINQRVEDKTKDFSAIDVEKLHLPKIDLPSQPQKKTELVEPKAEVEKQQAKQNNDVKTEVKNTNKSKADFQSKPQKKTKLVQSKADVKKEQTKQNAQVKTEVKNVSKKNKRPHFKSPLSQNKTAFTGFYEKIVGVKRISKTTKGGRNMRFSALAVIGDKNGLVGFGKGKSIEVPVAIKKALKDAKNNLVKVKITKNGSLFHEVIGKQGAGKVLIKPAPEGTGIIAGGPIRVVLELAGYKDIYSKNLGKNTSINMVRASINGLLEQKTPKEIAFLRDKKLTNL